MPRIAFPRFAAIPIRVLLLALVLAVALPLLASAFYTFDQLDRADEQAANTAALNLAQLTAANVNQFIGDSRTLLTRLAQRPAIRSLDPTSCRRLFDESLNDLIPRFVNLVAADARGTIVCTALPEPGGQPVSAADTRWFQNASATGDFAIGQAGIGRISGKLIAVLAYPLRNDAGQIVGVVGLPIDLARFHETFTTLALAPGTVITIVDGDGTIIARSSESEKWVGQNARGIEIVDAVLQHDDGTVRAHGVDGLERFYGFTRVLLTDWRVYVSVPVDATLASAHMLRNRNSALGALAILLAAFCALFLSAQIEKPIRALVATTNAVGRGEIETRAAVRGPREIATLATQFNAMLTARKQAEEALRASEHQYRALVEQASDGISVADQHDHLLDVNPALCALLGYTRDELLQLTVPDLHWPGDLDAAPLRMAELNAGATVLTERRLRRKDDTMVSVEVSARMIEGGYVQAITRDITERKRAEEALRASEERFLKLFHLNPSAIVLTRLSDRQLIEVNAAFSRESGYAREEVIGRTMEELNLWVDPQVRANYLSLRQTQGRVEDFEWRYRTKAGEIRHALLFGETIDIQGAPFSLVVAVDITARKRAEEALRASEERYHTLFNLMDEGVAINEAVLDEQGKVVDYVIVDANPAFEQQSIYTREQAIGRRATDLYQMSPEFIRDWWRQHQQMPQAAHTEMYHEPSERWFHITTTAPQEKRFATIFVDITERKRAEAQLQYQAQLLANVHDAIIATDDKTWITSWNRAAEELYDWTAAEVMGCSAAEVTRSELTQDQRNSILQQIAEVGQYVVEANHHHKEGRVIHVEARAASPCVRMMARLAAMSRLCATSASANARKKNCAKAKNDSPKRFIKARSGFR